MTKSTKLSLIGISWLSAWLRWRGLFANRFHADEALFASWARLIAVWRDPLLLTQPVDKPPLLFYLQAIFYPLFGPVEWAARMPNFIASLLLPSLVGLLAWRLYRDGKTAVIAALILTLSPLAIQFSPTAFTDPLLTTFIFASLIAASKGQGVNDKGHPIWSGILFGLAVATKHQAWLFLPLMVGTAVISQYRFAEIKRWLAGFLPIWLLVLGWTWAQTGQVSLLAQQMQNFGGLRLSYSWELWPRLQAWFKLAQSIAGWLPFILLPSSLFLFFLRKDGNFLLKASQRRSSVAPSFTAGRFWPRPKLKLRATKQRSCGARAAIDKGTLFDGMIFLYCSGYFLLHWLLAIPVWDRYLLPLVPLLAILMSRVWSNFLPRSPAPLLPSLLIIVFLLPGAWTARNGRLPIGGQPNADQGAAEVAELLTDAPYGTVLYDHWYSWQWQYHLFNKRVFVSWFPSPDVLVAELAVFGDSEEPRYLVLPNGDVAQPIKRAVETAGFTLIPVPTETESGMILYRISR